ncbi:hypothetical protein GCM10023084_56100 [Streptomyces lacrimifluminis]|uniref:ABC transmembrane type-1 domain-containing protein n=1 Tax=Streptomyces lacrimifluminis TaxID=1500077 RepID=A0A917NPG7_9ACTN|nr:hypothetical protein GCM10012282_10670 [Streptomyces lacrimifluminis]
MLPGWALGPAVAVRAGIVVGVTVPLAPYPREATASTIEFPRPTPSVALIPLGVLLYASELRSVLLLLVVYASFRQVLVQVLHGVQDVDPVADETARSYGITSAARLRNVVLPSAGPQIFAALRQALSVAVLQLVERHVLGRNHGLRASARRSQYTS